MQLVNLEFRKLNLAETVKQNKEVYDTATATHIVASTKSYNNLIEEYQAKNQVPTKASKKDLFLDRAKTEKAVAEMVTAQIEDKEVSKLVIEHINKVLDGGCVYYKPIIRNKK